MNNRILLLWLVLPVSGLIAQNIDYWTQLKRQPNLAINVKDPPYNAKCDSTTDDRVAIQAAINYFTSNTINGTIIFPANKLCGISPPYLTISPAASGLKLEGLGNIPPGIYAAGTGGGGVVAIGNSSNLPMFNVLGSSIKFKNMYIDGAAKAAIGIQHVANNSGLVDGVVIRNTTSDGMTICNECTPTMTITAGGGIGATSATMDSVNPSGFTVGGPGICSGVVFGYGTTNREDRAVTSGAGVNPITWTTPLVHAQTVGNCHGNDDFLKILNYRDLISGRWGLHVIAGADNNGMVVLYRQSNNATSGGDLWESGSSGTDLFGGYEGANGPAIQIGITSSTFGGPASGRFGYFADAENLNSLYNAVTSVCGSGSNTILIRALTDINFATSSSTSPLPNSCAAYPSGTADVAWGTNNSDGQLMIMTSSGGFQFDRNNSTGLSYITTTGTLQGSLIKSNTTLAGLESSKDNTLGTGFQFAVSDKTQPSYKTEFGIDHTGTFGWIQSVVEGGAKLPLKLNPNGGAVISGAGGYTFFGTLGNNISLTSPNYILTESGANNALVVTLTDSLGVVVPLNTGLRILVHLAHSLQAGANTLSFNGTVKNIVSNSNYGNNIGTGYITGSTIDLLYDNDVWMAMGR